MRTLLGAGLVLAGGLAMGGCYSAPSHISALNLDNPGDLAVAAPKYWDAKDLSTEAFAPRPRVAIVEFSVEYVTEKRLGLFGSRPVADVGEISITGGIADIVGFGRESLELDEETMKSLPGAILPHFEQRLVQAGFEILPPGRVVESGAFQSLPGLKPGDLYPVVYHNLIGSDTGRPKEVRVFPSTDLKVLDGDSLAQREAIRQLLAQCGGEIGLIVRIRVGADDGFASIEQDSEIRVISAGGPDIPAGRLTALRSILSDATITKTDGFELFSGSVTYADPELYRAELSRLIGPFTGMAITTLRGGPERAATGMVSGKSPPFDPGRD